MATPKTHYLITGTSFVTALGVRFKDSLIIYPEMDSLGKEMLDILVECKEKLALYLPSFLHENPSTTRFLQLIKKLVGDEKFSRMLFLENDWIIQGNYSKNKLPTKIEIEFKWLDNPVPEQCSAFKLNPRWVSWSNEDTVCQVKLNAA